MVQNRLIILVTPGKLTAETDHTVFIGFIALNIMGG